MAKFYKNSWDILLLEICFQNFRGQNYSWWKILSFGMLGHG